jgi:uncharacterized protein with PIN domain
MSRRYLSDGTVARLARWLRLFGLDVGDASGSDSELLRRARLESRTILTRCRRLQRRDPARVVLLASDDLDLQIGQVLSIEPMGEPLSRCSLCNAPLAPVGCEEAREHVPPYVYAHHVSFVRCPSCGRIYWEGTHVERIRRRFEADRRTRPGAPSATAQPRLGGKGP